MARTKLLQGTREALHTWMKETYDKKHIHDLDKLRATAVEIANKAIRKKYPEPDMIILRKYDLEGSDNCIKFVNHETQAVFGLVLDKGEWDPDTEKYKDNPLADVPYRRGCHSQDVFTVSPREQAAIEKFMNAKKDGEDIRSKKHREYRQFLDSCRFVEDVAEVIPFTPEMQQRYMGGGALMTITPEKLAELKKEFK